MNSYYDPANLKRVPELVKLSPQAAAAYFAFEDEVYEKSNALSANTKELIALAVAHVTGCPYCIDVHVQRAKKLGVTREEIVEAVLVAASTRSGAVLSHATHALNAYDQDKAQTEPSSDSPSDPTAPTCFC